MHSAHRLQFHSIPSYHHHHRRTPIPTPAQPNKRPKRRRPPQISVQTRLNSPKLQLKPKHKPQHKPSPKPWPQLQYTRHACTKRRTHALTRPADHLITPSIAGAARCVARTRAAIGPQCSATLHQHMGGRSWPAPPRNLDGGCGLVMRRCRRVRLVGTYTRARTRTRTDVERMGEIRMVKCEDGEGGGERIGR